MKLEIRKTLVMSTGHIKESDMLMLHENDVILCHVPSTECVEVEISTEPDMLKIVEGTKLSREFKHIYRYAILHNIDAVRFDADGLMYTDEFTLFDW